jgi:hypothetical protein
MTAWPTAKKQSDLLIAPDQCRALITDRGIDWVTDRFVIARADLWTRPVNAKNGDYITLTPQQFRERLTGARTSATRPEEIARDGDVAILRIGWALHGMNGAAWDGWNQIAWAKASPSTGWISWWQLRRGREVLVGVQAGIRLAWPTGRTKRVSAA